MIIPAVNIGGKKQVERETVVVSKKEELNKPVKQTERAEENEEEEVVDEVEEVVEVTESKAKEIKISAVPAEFCLGSVEEKWDDFVAAMKEGGSRLVALIGGARLLDYNTGVLKVEVQSDFHKQTIESARNRDSLATMFKDVYGFPVKFACEVNSSLKRKKGVSADVVLKNLPIAQKKVEPKKEAAQGNGEEAKPKKVSKRVEKIFEGM
jgi:hypothetical protein